MADYAVKDISLAEFLLPNMPQPPMATALRDTEAMQNGYKRRRMDRVAFIFEG